ncbi:hypothetical protein E5D57_013006 [Metarhizium anisopliae]|nr:hypothetical protein E5D57_013006 [Metarhizium anisopliae]
MANFHGIVFISLIERKPLLLNLFRWIDQLESGRRNLRGGDDSEDLENGRETADTEREIAFEKLRAGRDDNNGIE